MVMTGSIIKNVTFITTTKKFNYIFMNKDKLRFIIKEPAPLLTVSGAIIALHYNSKSRKKNTFLLHLLLVKKNTKIAKQSNRYSM